MIMRLALLHFAACAGLARWNVGAEASPPENPLLYDVNPWTEEPWGDLARHDPDHLRGDALKDKHLRPHIGRRVETIFYGVYVKDIYQIDIKQGTFVADIVLTLEWADPRVAPLVPLGHDFLTLEKDDAENFMWVPDIIISNRDVHGVDIISSSFNVSKMGKVMKIERLVVMVKNVYAIHAFPFDSQMLKVHLASSTLMADELRMVPSKEPGTVGIRKEIFDDKDFSLVNISSNEILEKDSTLMKSRGEFVMALVRTPTSYIQSMLVPCGLVLGVSYSAFWFPEDEPFAMPRTATALIAFLSLMTFSLKTNEVLPARGGLAWIDIFEQACQTLMALTVCFNIVVQIIYHKFGKKDLAQHMDNELKVFFPIMAAFMFGVVFWKTDGSNLDLILVIITVGLWLCAVIYAGSFLWRVTVVCEEEEEAARKNDPCSSPPEP